jgi:hypothetical protein
LTGDAAFTRPWLALLLIASSGDDHQRRASVVVRPECRSRS